jgi:hypothetical protein
VLAAIGVVTAAGCVSSGVLQGPETLPPGSSATGIKLSRHGNAMSAALSYRMGLTAWADIGADVGLSMVRVDPKVRLIDGPVSVAFGLPLSYNVTARDISYGNDEKKWVFNGIAGAHPAVIVGSQRFYAAVAGSYYSTRSGWRPAGSPNDLIAPRWFSYGASLGYRSSFSGPDSSRLVVELGYFHFPGWRSILVPSLSLQFAL